MVSSRASGVALLSVALGLGPGCAEVISRSMVQIEPRTDASALVLGPPGGEITARGIEARWTQRGDRLEFAISESRTCASVRHVPVVRIERVHRKTAGGAMWFEYGLGAALLATGLAGLIKPEAFSQGSTVVAGEVMEDTSAGYRMGGIFTALGVVGLTAGVVDTVRTRDEVIYTDAYRREQGGATGCREPVVPLRSRTVELLIDEWSTVEPTGEDGAVRFLLPAQGDLPQAARDVIEATAAWEAEKAEFEAAAADAAETARLEAEAEAARKTKKRRGRKGKGKAEEKVAVVEAEVAPDPLAGLGPRPEPMVVRGVLRVDRSRALAVDFLVPYEASEAQAHAGKGEVEPMALVEPPPRVTSKASGGGATGP